LAPEQRGKRSVVELAREDLGTWLTGTPETAMATLKLPPVEHYLHRAEDPPRLVKMPLK
jgi:hypothetical protein